MPKRTKTAHIAYKCSLLVRLGRSDRFCIPSAQEMRDSVRSMSSVDTHSVQIATAYDLAFAHKAWSSERETASEPLKAVREVKRSAMSGAQSAPSLENR